MIGCLNSGLEQEQNQNDITKSPNFRKYMDAFDIAVKELKENGKGYVKSAQEISEDG